MAKLVLAAGVPHPPRLAREIADAPSTLREEALMKEVRRYIEKLEPDVIIEVDSDHFVNFFTTISRPFVSAWQKKPRGRRKIGVRFLITRSAATCRWPKRS